MTILEWLPLATPSIIVIAAAICDHLWPAPADDELQHVTGQLRELRHVTDLTAQQLLLVELRRLREPGTKSAPGGSAKPETAGGSER